jgi:hypothetical protein
MNGYYAGLNACSSVGSNGGEDFEESRLPQSSQSGTWRLEVDSSSFGSDSVCASVEGFYGFGPASKCTNPVPNAEVSLNVPNREGYWAICRWLIELMFRNKDKYRQWRYVWTTIETSHEQSYW